MDIAQFIYTAPFVFVNVKNNQSFMKTLPDPLYIGEYE